MASFWLNLSLPVRYALIFCTNNQGLSPPWSTGIAKSTLKRSKLAIAGVAQSRQDITHVVEAFVQRGNVNIDVGMRLRELEQAVGSSDDADVAEAGDAALFQHVDGIDSG